MNDIKYVKCLRTKIRKGNPPGFNEKREKRIREGISFEAGSHEDQRKHIISRLRDGTEVYFLKPGKEAKRKKPNPHDMLPIVGDRKVKLTFLDIWYYLIKVGLADEEMFKRIELLIYRIGYMLDHHENLDGVLKYTPEDSIGACIEDIDSRIGSIFPVGGLSGFLNFIDILGWNEDIKYHTEKGRPSFKKKSSFKVGRINMILSCISVPFITLAFIKDIISHTKQKTQFDLKKVLDAMQRLTRSRGVCLPSKNELLEWLSPYLVEEA